ncbi:5'-nucleotidase C-terminal domain-containing protein [Clostridium sp. UBA1056]|uniref:bifunctional metallophosphatase/5'-nucleotidase n=1 Tax=unclassified Clostridium TaxID=2614128 RepID=UPI0032167AA7
MELQILHTNDIHSNFENFARIVTKINELRNENTIILDAGDFADFKRVEANGTKGMVAIDLLEEANYDAIAVGNNETFDGIDTLTNMASNGRIPLLSCHIEKLKGGNIEGINKSIVINRARLRILIIGTSPNLNEFSTSCGLNILDYLDGINNEIHKNEGKYDICIVLSHLGMDKDEEIAMKIPEVDVIIGGHFHILMDEPKIVNDTIIHTSGQFGEHLGVIKLSVEDNKVSLISGQNINIEELGMDEGVIKVLKKNKEIALNNLSITLYKVKENLWHDVIEENPITNLLADGLSKVYNCDFAFINSGVLNGGVKKGALTNLKLLQIEPSPLNPTYVEIQGQYILGAIKESLDGDIVLADGRGPGFRGKYVGRLHFSKNVKIKYKGRKVLEVLINEEPLKMDKVYRVSTSDYLHRGSGYKDLKNNSNHKYDDRYIRDILREYLCDEDMVNDALEERWIEV